MLGLVVTVIMKRPEPDSRKSVEEVLESLEKLYGLKHNLIANKRILFELLAPKLGKRIFLWTPESRIYPDGRAWVDLNELQKIEGENYHEQIGIIRLGDGSLIYINLEQLGQYLTQNRMQHNGREGNFWRFYIWHRKSPPCLEIYGRVDEGPKCVFIQLNNDDLVRKQLEDC